MTKILKYCIAIVVTILVILFSLDIQKLDEIKGVVNTDINATDYANRFWEKEIPVCIESATDVDQLISLLKTNPQQAFNEYSHQLGISHTYYFMVKGAGKILSVEEEYLVLETNRKLRVHIATAFIFGNAVRDGSGKVNIDDFLNMTAFNNVSVAINKLVKGKIVIPLKASAKPGMLLQFAGATEINSETMNLDDITIIPVSITLTDAKTE